MTCTSRDAANSRTAVYSRQYVGGGVNRGIIHSTAYNLSDFTVESWAPNIAGAGWPTVMVQSGTDWGNAAHVTRVTNGRTALISTYGALNGKTFALGISAGAPGILNWAKANPTLVQAIVLMAPAVDIQDIYTNNRGGYQSSISTAHGGAPADADTPAKNPSSFSSIPTLIYYSTDDNICTPTTVQGFGTAIGATMVSLGAVGHAITGLNIQPAIDFLGAHA